MTMLSLRDYAKRILMDKPVIVPRTPELTAKFNRISNVIYNCPHKNPSKRSFASVEACVDKMAIEHALAQVTGFKVNDAKFDHTNRHTYAYDVIDCECNVRFECKNWKEKWLSFYKHQIATMLKNIDLVDYLVSAKVAKKIDCYEVTFYLVANAKTFNNYVQASKFNDKMYYDHFTAMRCGDAVYRDHAN